MDADERQWDNEKNLQNRLNDLDDDGLPNTSESDYFNALHIKLFTTRGCHDTNIQTDGHALAFDLSSSSTPSCSSALSGVKDCDEIESFLTCSDTFLAMQISDVVQLSQSFDELDSEVEKVKIFVDRIPSRVNGSLLTSFLHGLGYLDVVRIDGPKLKNKNTKAGYAFVTFASPTTVIEIFRDYNTTPEKFMLNQSQLQLRKSRRQVDSTSQITLAHHSREIDSNVRTFELTSPMYGTLMATTAMTNLLDQRWQNARTSASQYGFMVHQRFDTSSTSSWLTIDTKKRIFRIDMIIGTNSSTLSESKQHFRFEWNFRDLKGNKFLRVLTHELSLSNMTASSCSTAASTYILCEIRRPPCISCIRTRIASSNCIEDEIRLAGSPLIGRANAWLFGIGSEPKTYADFASILIQHQLCAKGWEVSLSATDPCVERLIDIDLLLMKEWREKYRVIIEHFLVKRWPSFPFETKFEIMKLISKYIITIHDLIVDERLEFILSKMSANTLAACVDKITEFAHRWQPTSEKVNGEDWNAADDDEGDDDEGKDPPQIESYEVTRSLESSTDKCSRTVSPPSLSINLVRFKFKDPGDSSDGHMGSLGRLLCLGLLELRRNCQLKQIGSGIYLTKQEMRAVKANDMSSLRKVLITPSTMHFEGPHVEEASAVIRYFSALQDCFLRVCFRDEDYSKLKDMNNSMDILYKRICSLLTDSVAICGRKYRFLAFSSSQLREHSCWMYHQRATSNVSCERIREWMGDFRNIHPVAKVAARLGQSFSTTVKGRELSKDSFIEIPDVTSPMDNKALYTDGIGIIASWFADELAQQMGLPSTPSAFQIRFAGCKGQSSVEENK